VGVADLGAEEVIARASRSASLSGGRRSSSSSDSCSAFIAEALAEYLRGWVVKQQRMSIPHPTKSTIGDEAS
jgi:hypothetical protein